MIQVTLISLYGDKEDELTKFIKSCQEAVQSALGASFSPYDPRQIHATIVGLERQIGSIRQNLNFWKHHGRDVQMNFDAFLSFLRNSSKIPLEVQIGGFEDRDYPFASDPFEKGKDNRPYDRTFSIQGDKVVVMGWPLRGRPLNKPPVAPHEWAHESRLYPSTLDEIRHAAQRYGILHSYHKTRTAVDNDLFFRIGLIDIQAIQPNIIVQLVQQMRATLAGYLPPVIAQVTLHNLFIAAYEDDKLPLQTTQVWSVADESVTGDFVAGLYR